MRRLVGLFTIAIAVPAQSPQGFTLQQVLSAPYATNLTAAPVGDRFAWVEHTEGRNNLWVGGPGMEARQLTHNTADDAQDITQLAWSPDGSAIAYTYGAPNGASGKPANPAHLQRATPLTVVVQAVAAGAEPVVVGEGGSPVFVRDGQTVLFVRGGQIWMALPASCEPMSPKARDMGHPVADSGCSGSGLLGPGVEARPSAQQLIFDRGAASQLTLSPDGGTLAFISHRREEKEPGHSYVALFDVKTKTLTFPAASTGNDSAPVFSPDGKHLAWLRAPFADAPEFALNRVAAKAWSIQMLDLATHATRTVFAPEADKPGSVLPRMGTGEPRLFWTAGGRIVFSSEADGWNHLYAVDAAKTQAPMQAPMLLTPGDFEVEDPAVSGDGRTLVYAANDTMADPLHPEPEDADRRHVWGLDMTQAAPKPVFLTRGEGIETHPALTANGGTLAALCADAHLPMKPAVIAADGALRPLRPQAVPAGYPSGDLVAPRLVVFASSDGVVLHGQVFLDRRKADSPPTAKNDNGGLVAPRLVMVTAADGVVLHGQVFLGRRKADSPPTAKNDNGEDKGVVGVGSGGGRRPAVIFFHGGPQRQMMLGYPAMDYYSNAYAFNQYLVSRGFIVLSVNYRCGIGYGMDFRQCAHGGADGAAEYADVLAAQKYLASRPDVDAKRIGLWGGSYGGYLTALGLARNSDLFAAGVDFHGVHDWRLEDNAGDWLRGSNAEKDAIAAKAFASSPLSDVAKWRSPVLLIHGDDDPDVAYAQTPVLAEALRARNVPVETLIFPDEVHGFLLHRDWLAAYAAGAALFERVLKP